MDKLLIGLIVLLVIGLGAFFLLGTSDPDMEDEMPEGSIINDSIDAGNNEDANEEETQNQSSDAETKTFVLTGENFKFVMDGFDNPDLIVNEGDTVIIEFSSTGGLHDWVIGEFGASTPRVTEAGGTVTVEFVADTKGTFEYYCSVNQHRENGMRGNFIVQ